MIPFHFESGDPVSKCNVITYRLKRNVPPHSVLNAIYDLLNQYNISHRTCLWSLSKHVDTSGSGIRSNSVLRITKDYPQLADCYQKVHRDYDEIHRLTNYQDQEFVPIFPGCENEIRKIISSIHKPIISIAWNTFLTVLLLPMLPKIYPVSEKIRPALGLPLDLLLAITGKHTERNNTLTLS